MYCVCDRHDRVCGTAAVSGISRAVSVNLCSMNVISEPKSQEASASQVVGGAHPFIALCGSQKDTVASRRVPESPSPMCVEETSSSKTLLRLNSLQDHGARANASFPLPRGPAPAPTVYCTLQHMSSLVKATIERLLPTPPAHRNFDSRG